MALVLASITIPQPELPLTASRAASSLWPSLPLYLVRTLLEDYLCDRRILCSHSPGYTLPVSESSLDKFRGTKH